MPCKWAEPAEEAYAQPEGYGGDWGWKPTELWLCCWGIYHPSSADALSSSPPWLVKLALAGEPITEKTCESCKLREEDGKL
jgi:hypothetical protein